MLHSLTITVLVENTAGTGDVLGEHGLSFWLETPDYRVLFDCGQGKVLLHNAGVMGVDLNHIDALAVSHGHYDHTGGLRAVLELCPQAPVYAHSSVFQPRFATTKLGRVRSVGTTLHSLGRSDLELITVAEPTEVCDGLILAVEVPRITDFEDTGKRFFLDHSCTKPDPFLDDAALFFRSPEGVVVLTGCAHSGIVNIMNLVAELTDEEKFYCVMGGMHLIDASQERIKRTVEELRKRDVQRIGLGHCTGINAITKFWEAFPDRCFLISAGTEISFG